MARKRAETRTLAELNTDNRELALRDRHLAFTTYPELIYPIFLRPCTVRILIVTDGGGSFGNADFGLATLIDILAVSPGPFVRFAVTKAHRGSDPQADIANFRFNAHNLSDYDQIWMFAVERGSGSISDAEIRAVCEFMDGGGGVFATGDHEDLGVVMCGKLPRVRSMRKWHWPAPGPNNEPVAPPVGGPDRLDTLREGHDPQFQFDDQSDDVPQLISPRLYTAFGHSHYPWIRAYSYPHPLLCGPRGILRYLPDHPHEGECYVPSDLTKSFTFSGYSITEYPTTSDGHRLAPEVVAHASIIGGRTNQDVKGVVNPRMFGVIGAYNGHAAGVGRVAVDATWHHFFNINLIGTPTGSTPVKQQGFQASAQGRAVLEDIAAYYRNLGVWLARPQTQSCMRWRAIWASRWYHRLVMDFRPFRDITDVPLVEFVRIGAVAYDVLGRIATQCLARRWTIDLLFEARIHPHIPEIIDPWPPNGPQPRPRPEPDPVPWHFAELTAQAGIGATLYGLALEYPTATPAARNAAEKGPNQKLIVGAVRVAAKRVAAEAEGSGKELDELLKQLRSDSKP